MMMSNGMKKIVFFDADGTILDIKRGVPESAKRAIEELVRNGHEAFICTGRAYAFLPEEVKNMAFTGIIANGGAYMEYHGKTLLDKEVTTAVAEKSVEILRRNGMIPVMEGTDYMYYDDEYTDEVDWFASLITKQLGEKYRPIKGNEKNLHIAKISAKIMPGANYIQASKELEPYYDYVKHDEGMANGTIEYVLKGFTKGFTIALTCGVLGFSPEQTVCFGDSNNDLTMFDVIHTKVAMGNASPKLLARADYITEDMFHDGIYNGLKYLQLI